jgi:3'-phosphoadenosine 5'-phosphosulfate sulfotransferase (PAPS reductase)/FAD synthetase
MTNHPKFREGRTLVLTGERAEESKSRANYKRFERHRSDLRNGRDYQRHIDTWRPVHAWSEQQVWDIIKRWRVTSHPAYYLGYGRCSCRCCIFSSKDQWATAREIAPEQFGRIANHERTFKITIHRTKSVVELANAGTPYETDPFWVEIANSRIFNAPVFIDPWVLPKGAFGESCGPT